MQHGHTPLRLKPNDKKKKINIKYHTILLIPFIFFVVGFIVMPMMIIFLNSFTDSSDVLFQRISFTFDNYLRFFQDTGFFSTLLNSLRLGITATLICVIIAYPLAYWIAKKSPTTQMSLILLITAPIWLNMLLRLLALRQIFDGFLLEIFPFFAQNGRITGTEFAIIFAMVYVYIPFMILPIYTFLSKMDNKLIEASTDLGGSKFRTFIKVTLPLSIPGVLSGVTIVLLGASTSLTIPWAVGAGNTDFVLIGNILENIFINGRDWTYGSAIAVILLIIMMAMLWLANRFDRKKVDA